MKQDQPDAKNNVETRLEFIKSEMYACFVSLIRDYSLSDGNDSKRVEGQLKELQSGQEKKKQEVVLCY